MSKFLDEDGVKYFWTKTKSYVDGKVDDVAKKITGVYHWKGSVETVAALKQLPTSGLEVGDVYNVKENGMNYGWTGESGNPDYEDGWDPLGGLVEIPTLTTEDIDKLMTGG